jgi:hypothetical protein
MDHSLTSAMVKHILVATSSSPKGPSLLRRQFLRWFKAKLWALANDTLGETYSESLHRIDRARVNTAEGRTSPNIPPSSNFGRTPTHEPQIRNDDATRFPCVDSPISQGAYLPIMKVEHAFNERLFEGTDRGMLADLVDALADPARSFTFFRDEDSGCINIRSC